MKLIDRCSSCKHLLSFNKYKTSKYYTCIKLYDFIKTNYEEIKIKNPKKFGCIKWESKDETN